MPPLRPLIPGILESIQRQWQSPLARELGEAVVLIAGGNELKAALMLRQVHLMMEARDDDFYDREPVLRLSADAWSRVALRFASRSAEYTVGVSQRLRIDFLLEALADYSLLEDIPNQIRIYRAISNAHLSSGRPNAAAEVLEKAFKLARIHIALPAPEMKQLIAELAVACKTAFDRYPASKPIMAIRAAAYSQILGDYPQVLAYLGKAHDRLVGNAQQFHRSGQHEKASTVLSQAVVLGITAGREKLLEDYADRIVQHAILGGDTAAQKIYDRAIRLSQMGMGTTADRTIRELAQTFMNQQAAQHYLKEYHDLVDYGVRHFVTLAKRITQDGNYQDPKVLDTATAFMDAAYHSSNAWRRILDSFEPYLGKPFVEEVWKEGGLTLSMRVAHHQSALRLAEKHYQAAARPTIAPNVALFQVIADATDHPEVLSHIYMQIARAMNCSIAEAHSVFTPYGDARLQGRLREALGDLMFERLRSKAMNHDLIERRGRWDELVRKRGGKK